MTLEEWTQAVDASGLVEIECKRGRIIMYAFPSGRKIAEIVTAKPRKRKQGA